MSTHLCTLSIPVGGKLIERDALIRYVFTPRYSASRHEPAGGGVEIIDVELCFDDEYVPGFDWSDFDGIERGRADILESKMAA